MPRTSAGFPNGPGQSGARSLGLMGPTLHVDIGFDATFTPAMLAASKTPVPRIRQVLALVDTGAVECSIDSQLATTLGLPVVDQRPISGVGGTSIVTFYLAQVHVPALRFTLFGQFGGVHLIAGGQQHQALLGRSFLARFLMTYDGRTGEVTIAGPDKLIK
jgi:hypothetical protein